MFPLLVIIITQITTSANYIPMKSFKQFLIENPLAAPVEEKQCDINGICKIVRRYESQGNEQKILSVYKDSKGLDTVGHGHLVTAESPKIFDELKISQDVLKGKAKLTPEQADKLLERDVRNRLPKVQKMLPNFGSYSTELQGELASEYFRGMLPQSPKAVSYLNAGKFDEAAKEYLNAKEYRDSVAQKTGIAPRMKALSDAIKTEQARRQERQKSSL